MAASTSGQRSMILPVAESQDAVSQGAQDGVAPTVALERPAAGMVLGAIHLNHQTLADQEVHTPYVRDDDLPADRGMQPGQADPEQRFDARLTDTVREPDR